MIGHCRIVPLIEWNTFSKIQTKRTSFDRPNGGSSSGYKNNLHSPASLLSHFLLFFFYLTNSHHGSTAQYPTANELIPFVLTTHISWPIIQLFDLFFFFYLFSFAYFSFPIFFNNTQFNLLNTNPKNLIFSILLILNLI